ncbi:MAG: hypothetical protein Kow0029_30160 [Candidatus Rifleibacteriota bacterium]
MQLKRRLESLEQIISMGEKLLTTFDIEELLDGLVVNICKLLEAEGATLYLVDPFEGRLVSQSIKSDKVKEISLPIDNSSIAGHTAISRASLKIDDVYSDLSHIHPDLKFNREVDERSGRRTRSVITCPITIHNDLIGVFQVVNTKNGTFSEDDQNILRNFCLVAGVAIMNARLMERVLEAQASNTNIIDNISDLVVIQNTKGQIMHLNGAAQDYLQNNNRAGNFVGRNFTDVFPEFSNLASEISRLIDQRLDKFVSRGRPSYVILAERNFKHEIERVILILRMHDYDTEKEE